MEAFIEYLTKQIEAGKAETARLEAEGMGRKDAMREAAKKLGISRRDVYQALLK